MISRIRLAIVLATVAVAAAGCASGGNEVLRTQDANTVNQLIVDGRTSRSDVERIYGPPTATSFANAQNDIWIYRWMRKTAKAENFVPYVGAFVGGADIQKKELTILFNEQNVVVRHSMRDSTEEIRRNLSASSSPTPSAGQIETSPAPQPGSASASAPASPPASTAAVAGAQAPAGPAPRRSTAPVPTAASIETGRWACGMHDGDRRFTMNFDVAADRTITVATYGNAPATIVKSDPLVFTAINPRGSRLTTFTLKRDNAIVITGPNLSKPDVTFYNDGSCIRT